MKICICSSFKFYPEVLKLHKELEEKGFEVLIPIPNPFLEREEDILKNGEHLTNPEILKTYWMHLADHLKRMDKSDVIYIFSQNGYVGNGVSLEIGYAHSKNRKLISSAPIKDLPISCFIDEVVKPEDFVTYLINLKQ